MHAEREHSLTCITCGLRKHCLPRHLSKDAIVALDATIQRFRHAKGTKLYNEGQRFRHLYVVRSGSIRVSACTPSGKSHVLGFNLPGDIIGFDGAVSGRHTCTAEALEDSSSCTLTIPDLSALMERQPRLASRVLSLIAAELARAHAHAFLLSESSSRVRIAAFLDDLAQRYGAIQRSDDQLLLPMSRGDIASFTGLALETVSRALSRLHEEGVLHVSARHIRILDRPRLGKARASLGTVG